MTTLPGFFKIAALLTTVVILNANAGTAPCFAGDIKNKAATRIAGGDTTVYNSVDIEPAFPGGLTEFSAYLAKNIKYPAVDRENKVSGKVFTQFVVEVDGSLSNFHAFRSPSATLTAEAFRVLAASPKWSPGKINGKAVRVRFTMPVNFELPK